MREHYLVSYGLFYKALCGREGVDGICDPAEKIVCPQCGILDIKTRFNTSVEPAQAECSQGHEWTFTTEADA